MNYQSPHYLSWLKRLKTGDTCIVNVTDGQRLWTQGKVKTRRIFVYKDKILIDDVLLTAPLWFRSSDGIAANDRGLIARLEPIDQLEAFQQMCCDIMFGGTNAIP